MKTNKTEEFSLDTNSHHSSSLNRSVPSIRKLSSDILRTGPTYQKRTPRANRNSRHNKDELNDDLSEVTEKKNELNMKKHDTPNFEDMREFRSLRSS